MPSMRPSTSIPATVTRTGSSTRADPLIIRRTTPAACSRLRQPSHTLRAVPYTDESGYLYVNGPCGRGLVTAVAVWKQPLPPM
jgi:hypothetical protein